MDVRKIIKRVLLEVEEQQSGESYTDFIGRRLPSVHNGEEITNVKKMGEFSLDKIDADQYKNYCNTHINDSTSNFYGRTLTDCLNIHKKMIYDLRRLGAPNGVSSFTWSGQTFSACLRRDKEKETLDFGGYFGTINSENKNCYSPEWFYLLRGDDVKPVPKEIIIPGPDFK